MLGFALPGASVQILRNSLNVNGPGIRCATDGLWIEGNKLRAVPQGDRQPTGSGISLVQGLGSHRNRPVPGAGEPDHRLPGRRHAHYGAGYAISSSS